MNERWVTLESSAFGGTAVVRSIDGREALNELFTYEVQVTLEDVEGAISRAGLLADRVTLKFEERGEVLRRVHGIVSEVEYTHGTGESRRAISLTVVPRTWQLTQRFGAEVFLGVSVPEVLQRKLEAIGLKEGRDFVFSLARAYPMRELVVQYEETDYAFFSRLCEHEGIITRFEHDEERDVLLISDVQSAFPVIERAVNVPVRAQRDHPAAYDVSTLLRREPESVLVHDYNYRAPRLALGAERAVERPSVAGSWVVYGAHTKSPDETDAIARVRAEAAASRHEVTRGGCSELSLHAGGVFSLDHPLFGEQRLLITKMTMRGQHGEGASHDWDSRFEAIPAGVPFRPEVKTPRPRVTGLVNARVDGQVKGHYAEIDAMGRYHLQLGFDRSQRTDLLASHPVRMMQPHAGAHYGMHSPLQPGTEVLVGFVDGNPDRPVIVGAAPNPETASPVDAENHTQNVLRTKSSNELVLEDALGGERIRIHTPHQNTTVQLGSPEEPEEGALTATDASITQASVGSHNVAARRSTLLTGASSTVAGQNVMLLAGIEAVSAAAERGLRDPQGLFTGDLARDLGELSLSPEARAAGVGDETRDDTRELEVESLGGLWSQVGQSVSSMAESAGFAAMRALASASDLALDAAVPRGQGQRLGAPLGPSVVLGAAQTAAVFGRDVAMTYGDRAAVLASHDTASVVGGQHVELQSPGRAEVAGATAVMITSAGELSAEAATIRLVGGYYPEASAPPLDASTSVGVMSRRDLRVTSVEDCVLICAQKNLVGSAHEGDVRLTASDMVRLQGATIAGYAGEVRFDAENVFVTATGDVEIEAQTVTIRAASITLDGSVYVTGDLTVEGKLDVKDDSKLASG